MFKLVIADDEGKTTVVPLVRDEITVGRKEGNTIRLTERNVSRRHAKLRKANGAFVVEDLQSYNGVKVNGRKIAGETVLKAGDQVTIGDYQLALQLDGADSPTVPDTTAPMTMPNAEDGPTAMVAAPAPQPGPPPRLVMMSPPAPGAEFAIGKPVIRIGRAEELDIWVNHRSISREHAEVTRDSDNVIRLRDLGSANGVRVNGADTQQATLSPGDVIELGQVRFRFVAAGEHFTFDAERTIQLDAAVAPPAASRAPMYAAIVIVLLAIAGGLAAAMSGDPPEQVATAIDDPGPVAVPPTPVPPPVAPTLDPEVAYRAALESCEAQLTTGNFDEAAGRAAEALRVRPGDAAAQACADRVAQAREENGYYADGIAALRSDDLAAAFLAFERLPRESSYRQRDDVRATMARFAQSSLEEARALLQESPADAQRLAEMVSNMTDADAATRRAARGVVVDAQRRAAAVARAERGSSGRPSGGSHSGGSSHSGGGSHSGGSTSAASTGGGRPPPPPPPPDPPSSGDALAAARGCLARGDEACAVRALSSARDADSMALLIQVYRDSGNMPRALDTADQFIRRFPTHRRTQGYRQFLSAHGR